MIEEWKWIQGYEGRYKVSNLGRVMSVARKHKLRSAYLKPKTTPKGYLQVLLYKNNTPTPFYIHRLVGIHFIEGDINLTINHKDGNKTNNCVENLEWVSMADNNSHASATGLFDSNKGEKCHAAKLNSEQVRIIKSLLANGVKGVVIARTYDISTAMVSLIKNNKKWKHLN